MNSIYENGEYLELTKTWHAEDSPWKAEQIYRIILRNQLNPHSIAEIGCGAGGILQSLHDIDYFRETEFTGYDISPHAIELANSRRGPRISFFNEDMLLGNQKYFDLLLVIDVFEHVEDYIGFLKKCRTAAEYKIFHIPLDIHVSSVIRKSFIKGRYSIGHLHYFTAESALATLKDAEYEIVDMFYTNPTFGLFRQHPSVKRAIANIPRWLFSKISVAFSARVFGGYSLLVLAR
ncbi:MAG: class I SAM-dependent methyltransferase [Lysobacterales bacterium]